MEVQQRKEKQSSLVKQTPIVKSLRSEWNTDGPSDTDFEITQGGPGLNQLSTDASCRDQEVRVESCDPEADEMVFLQR